MESDIENCTPPESSSKNHLSKLLGCFSKDPVSKNAVILLSTWFMNAAVGFIFIFIAAKLYTIDAVGTAMVLFSYSSIVILASRFGIQQSMIGYYNEDEKSSIYWLTLITTTIPAIILGFFLVIISYMGFLGENILAQFCIVFIIGLILSSASEVSGFFFLASGNSPLYFIQSVIIGSRILFLIAFVSFSSLGIFSSLVVATGLSVGFSLLLIHHKGVRFQITDKKFLRDSLHFSLGNYISDFFMSAPIYIIPIIIFSQYGKGDTAIYSVGYAIASIAFLIPTAIGYASFISGSPENTGSAWSKKIIFPTLLLQIGIILVFFIWGKDIINLLGPDYSGTSDLVVIIMCASVFALFFQLYSAEFKIRKQINKLILINVIFFTVLIVTTFLIMKHVGLLGAGYAWIASYMICVAPIEIYKIIKKRSSSRKMNKK